MHVKVSRSLYKINFAVRPKVLNIKSTKQVLVAVSRALTITCVEAPKRPEGHYCLHLARLALLQDYLVRHPLLT